MSRFDENIQSSYKGNITRTFIPACYCQKQPPARGGCSFFVRQMGLLCGYGYRCLPLALRAARPHLTAKPWLRRLIRPQDGRLALQVPTYSYQK